ncbi:sensor histidine kinase [Enterococcus sp. LJL98]
MIKNNPKLFIALYSGFSTFLLLVLVLFSYGFALGNKKWLLELFQIKFLLIPFAFYLFALSVIVGAIIYLFVSFYQKRLLMPIEEKLRLLAGGNFDNPILDEGMPYSTSNQTLFEMDNDFYMIRMKLKEILSELQVLNSRPQLIDGVSKEEILENERHRLARELHDSVSQQLFAAMMLLSALDEQGDEMNIPVGYQKQLEVVTGIINAAQSEMRALLLHLRPVTLEGKTLKKGIEQLLIELKTKVNIELKWEVENVRIPLATEDQLFRVIQELLSNTLRHAKATELEVYLHQVNQSVLLRVIDDGIGFDVEEKQNKAGSYGLMNIRERVASTGGTLKIISFPKQGTSIEVKIPLLGGNLE